MLSTMRRSWLVFALFALIAVTHALNLDSLHVDGIEEYLHHGKRQRPTGTGNESVPPETSTPPPPPSSTPTPPPSSDEPSTTQDPPPSSTPAPPPPTSPTPNTTPTTTPPSSKTRVTTPIVRSTPLVSTDVQEYITIYTTVSDGRTFQTSATTRSTNIITTGQALSTEMPLPQNGDGNSGGGGLSESNKKIIGGVVGGVGGAILLGGIAIVLLRVYGRKNRVSEDDDDLAAGTGAALGDKPHSSSTGNSPFQSNLEQYHNPGGRPNAAANF
ncbi:uncharacterized protein EI97DRAFT_183749 [Westerdykella ornata]|uniref:Mid2 domain-containing protein n=1 Tax=Westerdykella ornata TaxID=318751 RepID=A0A6A6JX89_WESOR|nr:uncharacterized protein EI97DRAFT_183749 [Westerdykella ornata]KAF2279679.1 hypothetical protein EI97DRAFT_183749 [Westerdykella ornata]